MEMNDKDKALKMNAFWNYFKKKLLIFNVLIFGFMVWGFTETFILDYVEVIWFIMAIAIIFIFNIMEYYVFKNAYRFNTKVKEGEQKPKKQK
jgi:hypothetical protein